MLNGNPFDLVIMDLNIYGGMDGEETIKKLLAIDPNAKAIVSSGYSSSSIMSDPQKYGFKCALVKPYLIGELRQVVTAVINEKAD
jgi:DNA-binding NarL/FixJ family response regulator